MKYIFTIAILLTICSCTSKYERLDKYFIENTDDTIHVYCIDLSSFIPDKDALWQIDYYKLPDSLYKIKDTLYDGKIIPKDLVKSFRLDEIHDSLFNSLGLKIEKDNQYNGVFKYSISKDYYGFIVSVIKPYKHIVLYTFNKTSKKIDGIVYLAGVGRTMSDDNDCNSWIFDIDNDSTKDILTKSSSFEYGEMDNLKSSDSTLSSKAIIDSVRFDTALTYLWKTNKFVFKPTNFKSVDNKFQFKMIEYYNGYRGCYWFDEK